VHFTPEWAIGTAHLAAFSISACAWFTSIAAAVLCTTGTLVLVQALLLLPYQA
jgi:hypothetical protein